MVAKLNPNVQEDARALPRDYNVQHCANVEELAHDDSDHIYYRPQEQLVPIKLNLHLELELHHDALSYVSGVQVLFNFFFLNDLCPYVEPWYDFMTKHNNILEIGFLNSTNEQE